MKSPLKSYKELPANSLDQLSSSTGSTLVKWQLQGLVQEGHFDRHNAYHTPKARMVCSAFHSIKVVIIRALKQK